MPAGTEALKPFEEKMALAGEWMRFSAWSWFVSSQYNPTQIRDILRPVLNQEDHFVVLEVDMNGADGYALAWIWEWLRKKGH